MALIEKVPPDLLLCVFVHGFKGDDTTFGDFPSRLAHNLQATIQNVTVECILFPVYETKGGLRQTTDQFVDWLIPQVQKREVARAMALGDKYAAAGVVKVVLCGHSMGGLVVADAMLLIDKGFTDGGPLWPRIISVLAFDTPYLGLHTDVFKNQASDGIDYYNTAQGVVTGLSPLLGAMGLWGASKAGKEDGKGKEKPSTSGTNTPKAETPSSSWGKWAALGGATVAAGAAATAWYNREQLTSGVNYGWKYLSDHFQFVSSLWSQEEQMARLNDVIKVSTDRGVTFRAFYTYLPKKYGQSRPRTFIALPSGKSVAASRFIAAHNSLATNEVTAHMGMFSAKTNDGYYELGGRTVQLITESIHTLLEEEKTMHVHGDARDEEAEFEKNRTQVAQDRHEAEAATKAEEPSDAELSGAPPTTS
ncbi:hypothetical protein M408DRAFT_330903 [Serendipita vermifera MAFF 305830]|uniref:DUF676 domain-containing protein n=1 Tax=Serendipita vermifera MAFF 305830 TaxID=933852 RepID=A0A0C3B2Z6_SERVB|nr:hypothetical protein M408DRAFT_330903 [Serendipita vermifera MAFF 305830]